MPAKKNNFTATEIKAGVMVLASLLVMVFFVAAMRGCGSGNEKMNRFSADFSSIIGLNLGADVRFGGVKAGKVLEIQRDAGYKPGLVLEGGAIHADGDRVGQILRNLIDNAFKFTPRGGRVTIRTRVERDWVIIDVVDDGLGIHPADVDRIFEEFVQLKHPGARRKHRGSGLGLAISQRIAEAHGGAIELESTVDEGSVFSVRLPREHDEIE